MSSLGDIQQTYSMLQQIYDIMQKIETQSTTTEQKLQRTATQAVLVNQLLHKTLTLFQRMGLPEDVNAIFIKVQRLISIINQVRLAVVALNAYMAGTPGGLLIAGISGLMIAMDVGDLMMS